MLKCNFDTNHLFLKSIVSKNKVRKKVSFVTKLYDFVPGSLILENQGQDSMLHSFLIRCCKLYSQEMGQFHKDFSTFSTQNMAGP